MTPQEFENELRAALRREPAPEGFASRVIARTPRRRRVLPWALAAGLAAGLVLPLGVYEHRREQAVRAEQAKRELVTALNITRAKIRQTRESIQRRANRI